MKFEVGYAFYEGTLRRWETLPVAVLSTTKHRKRTAKTKALAELERSGVVVSEVWIDFIDHQCAVECFKCGSWQVHLIDVEYANGGELVTLDEPIEIAEDGEVTLPSKFIDEKGFWIVDKLWAVCDHCGQRASIYDFVDN